MPKTSVSRKVAELEDRLGAQLLHRTRRTISLTDAGAAFVEEAELAIARLEAAEQAVSQLQREPRGRLRVTTTIPLGQVFLAPLVAEFLALYPAVEVTPHLTDRHVDLVSERFDVALRTGVLADSSLVAVLVGASVYRLVASRATSRSVVALDVLPTLRPTAACSSRRSATPSGRSGRSRRPSESARSRSAAASSPTTAWCCARRPFAAWASREFPPCS